MISFVTQWIVASTLFLIFPLPHSSLGWKTDEIVKPSEISLPTKMDPRRLGVETSAISALVMDHKSGGILFEKNPQVPRSIGSITKLMTAFIFLEGDPELDKEASIEPEDIRIGGIQHLDVGKRVRVRDLVYASLVASDNSATAALVRLSGMPYGDFVARMNETAAAIGMGQTRFVDATGLSSKNTSVVMDIARLVQHVSRHDIIRDATTRSVFVFTTLDGSTFSLDNTNDLLTSFVNRAPFEIMTSKTGFLPEAGYCLGAMFSKNGTNEIIAVVLGSDSDLGRFQDVKALAAWTYEVYEWGKR